MGAVWAEHSGGLSASTPDGKWKETRAVILPKRRMSKKEFASPLGIGEGLPYSLGSRQC